ncbi:MAG: hypothetical protein NTX22_16305 [Ignavibacteriales bacterium]|nr:hypothetical protein [Ignavibacteriales bacterium]
MRIKFFVAIIAAAFLFSGFNSSFAQDKVKKEVKTVQKSVKKDKMNCDTKLEKKNIMNCCAKTEMKDCENKCSDKKDAGMKSSDDNAKTESETK